MKKIKQTIIAFIAVMSFTFMVAPPASAINQDQGGGAACSEGRFLTFPTWYRGLQLDQASCVPRIAELNDIWKIVLNFIEIMMQAAGYIAAGLITWGGFKYMKSQGNPQNIASAKSTIMNAAIGLGVALSAVAIVNFVGTIIK